MSLCEDFLEEDGLLDGYGLCGDCRRPLTQGERRHNGFRCHGCSSRRRRERGETPALKRTKPAAVRPLGPGVRVRLDCWPAEIGVIERKGLVRGWWVTTDYGTHWYADADVRLLAAGLDAPRTGEAVG
jgi:hypothetical protein